MYFSLYYVLQKKVKKLRKKKCVWEPVSETVLDLNFYESVVNLYTNVITCLHSRPVGGKLQRCSPTGEVLTYGAPLPHMANFLVTVLLTAPSYTLSLLNICLELSQTELPAPDLA